MAQVPPDLLQPSLSGRAELKAAPYSHQTAFLTAFFGGPLAIILLFAIDAVRLGRLGRDAVWIAVMFAAYGTWLTVAYKGPAGESLQRLLVDLLGARGPAIAERLLALLLFALAFGLHRREQRSADLFELARPKGLPMGLGLIVAGTLLSAVVRTFLR